jgi:hypothetical protein
LRQSELLPKSSRSRQQIADNDKVTADPREDSLGPFLPRKGDVPMKVALVRMMILVWLPCAGTPAAFAQTAPHTLASNAVSAETEVRRLNIEEVGAFIHNDPKAMDQLWSDDMVVTNPLNKFVNKRQVLEMVKSGFLVITSYDRQIEYLRVYGDTVIAAGNETVVWGGKMPNAGKTEHLRFTGVWMKQRGHWREVARHANIVPQ